MNSRLTTSLLIALVVSGLFTFILSKKMSAHAATQVPEIRYVAPSKPLQPGEVLKADSIELVSWPTTSPIQGAFLKTEDLIGRSVLYPMDKGQPITDKLLSAPGSGLGLAGRIPDGMRAIALRSDEVVGVAGFLMPGSHLDVLVTYRTDKSPEPATMTILQNAEVLAAGHQVQPDPEGKPATVTVVTLLLKPEDAERVVLAGSQGTIHFVLRSGSDKGVGENPPILLSQLWAGPKAAPNPDLKAVPRSAPRPERTTAPREISVETVSGDKHSTATFSGAFER